MRESVAVHVPCSSKKMGIEESFIKVASLCADTVVSSNIPCCGMAGDRGMRYPELTGAALQVRSRVRRTCMQPRPCCLTRTPTSTHTAQHLNVAGCSDGYSTSRTCEMSLRCAWSRGGWRAACANVHEGRWACAALAAESLCPPPPPPPPALCSNHSGINFRGLVYLVDEATRPKQQQQATA